MSKRFVVLHGHFYQPPRENPGLGFIEPQPSAAPHRDWNERITAECYRPNAAARLLDGEGRLRALANNYSRLGFDFGPTLLSWLERHATDVHAAIVAGDRESCVRFRGHGGALAHPYHHSILPLATARDRATEIRWGLVDFEWRFGRKPEGCWLPETAADVATLDALAAEGIRFTVLAPRQAKRIREAGGAWRELADGDLDTRRPYVVHLPSGRSLAVFFYDGALSQAVAFERLLDSADRLVARIVAAFESAPSEESAPQLVALATDGETYGHHHRFGEMALARAFELLAERDDLALTTFGAFLAAHPPQVEVEIVEPSAWSCAHGVGRWKTDCSCRFSADRHQRWRAPLRVALDGLRDSLAEDFATTAGVLLRDPWTARDAAIVLQHDRSSASATAFLDRHATRPLSSAERVVALELLEAQRQSLAMFTSCAWFFDDLAGIETIQVLAHADRAIELHRRALGVDLAPPFVRALAQAAANDPADGDGARLVAERVAPLRGDLERVARHAAMLALRDPQATLEVCGHRVERLECASLGVGDATLALGVLRVRCLVTGRATEFSHAVVEQGRLSFTGAVASGASAETLRAIESAFARATSEGVAAIERLLPAKNPPCGLEWVLPQDRERFVEQAFVGDLRDLATIERRIADGCGRIAERLASLGVALPTALARVLASRDEEALVEAVAASRTDLAALLRRLAARRRGETGSESSPPVARIVRRLCDELRAAVALDDGGVTLRETNDLIRALFAWRRDHGLHEMQDAFLRAGAEWFPRLEALARHDALARRRSDALLDTAELLRTEIRQALPPSDS